MGDTLRHRWCLRRRHTARLFATDTRFNMTGEREVHINMQSTLVELTGIGGHDGGANKKSQICAQRKQSRPCNISPKISKSLSDHFLAKSENFRKVFLINFLAKSGNYKQFSFFSFFSKEKNNCGHYVCLAST